MYVRDFSNVFSFSNALQRLSQFSNAYWLALAKTYHTDIIINLAQTRPYKKASCYSHVTPRCGIQTWHFKNFDHESCEQSFFHFQLIPKCGVGDRQQLIQYIL
ncbi:Hypothetical_protein [Hexamita inflata]|uniref:Hypothetical_protein n=1 Tax=Hexamita inflata TaxID=28002 RepID=A0AA86P6Q5_9EUKA|nr:Hypothetical protein HINF_LOCUS19538 [Hexamita inflata]